MLAEAYIKDMGWTDRALMNQLIVSAHEYGGEMKPSPRADKWTDFIFHDKMSAKDFQFVALHTYRVTANMSHRDSKYIVKVKKE